MLLYIITTWNNPTNLSLLASREMNTLTCAGLWWHIGAREYLTVEHYYLKSWVRYIEYLPSLIITGYKWDFLLHYLAKKIKNPLPFVLSNARDRPLCSASDRGQKMAGSTEECITVPQKGLGTLRSSFCLWEILLNFIFTPSTDSTLRKHSLIHMRALAFCLQV